MRSKRSIFIALFVFIIGVGGQLEAARLHAIYLCDTLAVNISTAIDNDLKIMQEEVHRIAVYTDLELNEILMVGGDLQPKAVFKVLKALEIDPEDRIFFYFSGHGYRTPKKGSNQWPYLYFTAAGRGIDFDEVCGVLKKKDSTLFISVADCCNNILSDSYAPPVYHCDVMSSKGEKQLKGGYKKLFLDTQGTIIMSSSIPGQYSWCYQHGAIFTLALVDYIKKNALEKAPCWHRLLLKTSASVVEYQTPQYVVDLQ